MIRRFWRWVRIVVRRRHPLEGRRLALVMVSAAGSGSEAGDTEPADDGDEDAALLRGVVRHDGRRLVLDWGEGRLPLDAAWLDEARPASPDLRDILGDAEFWVAVPVAPLAEGIEASRLEDTGLAWPGSKAAGEPDVPAGDDAGEGDEGEEQGVAGEGGREG